MTNYFESKNYTEENKVVVRLFELALAKAKQLSNKDYHPHDVALNASAIVESYIETEMDTGDNE